MGTLYLVRHGQASFGADDYDQLSPLGQQQSQRLGQYWRARWGEGLRFDAVLTGSLRRQVQTWHHLAEGAGLPLERTEWPGLNEYDSHAVIAAVHPDPLPKPDTPERYRQHFRLLREGLSRWMAGDVQPVGMPSHTDFLRGVTSALAHVQTHCQGNALLVSSGGPIATAVAHVLQAPPQMAVELNLRIRNTAVTEFHFSPRRHTLMTYNSLPHLDELPYRDWVTYT
ncbi:histidine phosphatase family protein [Ottowia sp.]|uniref:histidine phosphatase family protein n=1 Tax=Ottowia sp. TaxID=1898956 RepID=UPI003A84469B